MFLKSSSEAYFNDTSSSSKIQCSHHKNRFMETNIEKKTDDVVMPSDIQGRKLPALALSMAGQKLLNGNCECLRNKTSIYHHSANTIHALALKTEEQIQETKDGLNCTASDIQGRN
jgi:hypothetical protein